MRFDWADYLSVADGLVAISAQHCSKDGCHRAAISRAYYAAFHKAKEALPQSAQDRCPAGADAHPFVQKEYALGSTREEKIIANDLKTLRTFRNRADYEPEWSHVAKQSFAELRKARRIIEILRRLTPPQA